MKLPDKLQVWVEARKRFHLSHGQVQMARELGMNPKKLGEKANQDQEPWKMPLPQFIKHRYRKSFGRDRPEVVLSIEQRFRLQERKKAKKREAKKRRARHGLEAQNGPDRGGNGAAREEGP